MNIQHLFASPETPPTGAPDESTEFPVADAPAAPTPGAGSDVPTLERHRAPWPHRLSTGPTSENPGGTVALIGANLDPTSAKQLFSQLHEGGYQAVLIDRVMPLWARPYMLDHLKVAELTPSALTAAIEGYPGRIEGVVCWERRCQPVAAATARRLGLPAFGEAAAVACADHATTQALLTAAGCRTVRSLLTTSPDEALRAAGSIGYPIMLLTRTGAGKLAARRVDEATHLPMAYAETKAAAARGEAVQVEEAPLGEPVTIECLVRGGEPVVVAVVRQRVRISDQGHRIDYLVDAADPLVTDKEVGTAVAGAVTAIGARDGHCQVELLLTGIGSYVVGIQPGPANGLVSHLVHLATGNNMIASTAATACGHQAEPAFHKQNRTALLTAIDPPDVDTPTPGLTEFGEDPAWVGWLEQYVPPLIGFTPRTGQPGWAVVTGRDPFECEHRAARLHSAVNPASTVLEPAQ
ncbi:hypothetical protein J5X84_31140 [Streptosporangiaceae bacterium NEAU-GS5]|nr:hypothetical protein [Streptosporangiaceae bacterium NEAU-GS5]